MASGRPLVSAIVVSQDQREQLLACLGCYFAGADVPVEAVVVDNASSDGTAEAVALQFPAVKVVRRIRDTGYGRAGNAGLSVADGRFILLLDPCVSLQAGCVGKLADFLLVRPDAGAVGPRLLGPEGRLEADARRGFPTPGSRVSSALGLSRLFARSARFNRHNMGHLRPTEVHEIDAGSLACLMVRRAAVDRVGFFDPDYFRYGEDLDLCYRLKMGGWKVFYLPDAVAIRARPALPKATLRQHLWELHSSLWTFHHKHYAAQLPAFANGLVWLTNWGRWAYLSARAEFTGDPGLEP